MCIKYEVFHPLHSRFTFLPWYKGTMSVHVCVCTCVNVYTKHTHIHYLADLLKSYRYEFRLDSR